MTPTELQSIKARVTPTICDTWRGEHDGGGRMITAIEGRISADDFTSLCMAAEETERLRSAILHALDCLHHDDTTGAMQALER